MPIINREGNVLGAIGCSTGTPAQDEDVAMRGVEAVLAQLKAEAEGGGDEDTEMDLREEVGKRKQVRELTAEEHVKRYRAEVTPPPERAFQQGITVL